MNKRSINFLLYLTGLLLVFQLISCSASTGSRYEKTPEKKETKETSKEKRDVQKSKEKEIAENFDFTPFRTEIEVEEKSGIPENNVINDLDIWYDYEKADSLTRGEIMMQKVSGFRVQVLVTDDLDEANKMRTDISSNTFRKSVYIIFDPPFYKVLVGDFTKISDANDLSFRLSQIGYTEARVISDTVNIFRQ